jgi:long-subunit fatty acid transport protein
LPPFSFARAKATIEADLGLTFWSSFDAVSLSFPDTPAYDQLLPQDYGNAWRLAIGAEYAIGPRWEVRGGYSYDRSPQPALTLSPFLPDANRHALAAGGTYKYGQVHVDLVGRLLLYGDRTTDGLSEYGYDGVYQSHGFSVTFSIGVITYVTPSTTVRAMLHSVDSLMYAVKKRGKNDICHALYDPLQKA